MTVHHRHLPSADGIRADGWGFFRMPASNGYFFGRTRYYFRYERITFAVISGKQHRTFYLELGKEFAANKVGIEADAIFFIYYVMPLCRVDSQEFVRAAVFAIRTVDDIPSIVVRTFNRLYV